MAIDDVPRPDVPMPVERRPMTPVEELEYASLKLRLADLDEFDTMENPERPPRAPHPITEPVTDRLGEREVDIQRDTPIVDFLAGFDLSDDELLAADPIR